MHHGSLVPIIFVFYIPSIVHISIIGSIFTICIPCQIFYQYRDILYSLSILFKHCQKIDTKKLCSGERNVGLLKRGDPRKFDSTGDVQK